MSTEIPYYEIPEAPEQYNAATMVARTIDGLGYRLYWSTEGLKKSDLAYKPSEEGRNIDETMEHVYNLCLSVAYTVTGASEDIVPFEEGLSFEERRVRSLVNLKLASDYLRANADTDFDERNVIFKNGGEPTAFPFWNLLNGPLGDAIWHTGQFVVLRRSAGNPIPKGVNVFIGKTKE